MKKICQHLKAKVAMEALRERESLGDGLMLYKGVKGHILYYNHGLHQQVIGRKIPAEQYRTVA